MLNYSRILIGFAALAIVLFTGIEAWASAAASGTFTAEQTCEAFVSKNKRTNPDNTTITLGERYPVFEVNRPDRPSWYRVRIEGAQPPERWVDKRCGIAVVQIGDGERAATTTRSTMCNTAGLRDSFKLALSWQPAFCEGRPSKPECRIDRPSTYQARNFTLHGLWPNKKECGTDYNFCGEIRSKPGEFCDYPALELFTAVRDDLERVMPSAAAGSCLQRHEWFKHGTCQTEWSVDEYYIRAIDMTRQFNESGVAYFMARNIGQVVSEEAFFQRVDCALGMGSHQRLQLKCKNGNLVDVYINLPADIGAEEDLGEIIARAEPSFRSDCGGQFRVDPIGLRN
jgi:ribonuclease T2